MMKKAFIATAAFAVTAATTMAMAPTTAEAVPAFARQTGAACLSCHFQAIPRLAAMGRNFKIGGYIDMGDQELLEDDALSLPATFNASLVFKARIMSQSDANITVADVNGNAQKSGIQWPDEAALLIGGRYGEHIGGLTEWNGGPLSYKIDFVYDLDFGKLAVAGGSTDALGAPYLFNDPSNVLVRNTRGWQFRPDYMRNTGLHGGVSGLGVYAHINDLVFVSLGQFVDNGGNNPNGVFAALDFLTWARVAVTTEVAGFDTVAGIYSVSGTQDDNISLGGSQEISTTGIDVQLQGDLGDMTLGFYGQFQFSGKQSAATFDLNGVVNGGVEVADDTGFLAMATLGFGHAGVRLGYEESVRDTPAAVGVLATSLKENSTVIGAWYSIAQNVELDLEYQAQTFDVGYWRQPAAIGVGVAPTSNNITTLMLEYVY